MRVSWAAITGIVGVLASVFGMLQVARDDPDLMLILIVLAIGSVVAAIAAGAWSLVRRVRATPRITSLDPPIGRIGDELDVNGEHLPHVELAVVFGGNRSAEQLGVRGARLLRVRVPAGAQDGPIEIRTADGMTLASPLPFIVAQSPEIRGVSPTLAPPGAEVALRGAALYVGHTTVHFGEQASEVVRHVDATGLVVRVPANAPDGPLQVQTPGGIAHSAPFTVAQPPEIRGVSPTLAPPGAEVALRGTALYVGHTAVKFGAHTAEIVRHDDPTGLVVRVPASAPDGPLQVQTPGGMTQSTVFSVGQLPPLISALAPTEAPAGAEVTLHGAALYVGDTTVWFGRGAAAIAWHVDTTRLVVRVPVGAPDGPLQVQTSSGTVHSSSFTVTQPRVDRAGAEYVPIPAGAGLSAFWIMRTPVTNAQYRRAVQSGACTAPKVRQHVIDWYNLNWPGWVERLEMVRLRYAEPEYDDHPVVWVTRAQARVYAAWVGGRLPRDAEWTRAAQGDDGRIWPWGNTAPDATRANYGDVCRHATPVGAYPAGASPYGVLDMSGNVWEWVEPDDGGDRPHIARGGAFPSDANEVVCSARRENDPVDVNLNLGFRVVFHGP